MNTTQAYVEEIQSGVKITVHERAAAVMSIALFSVIIERSSCEVDVDVLDDELCLIPELRGVYLDEIGWLEASLIAMQVLKEKVEKRVLELKGF